MPSRVNETVSRGFPDSSFKYTPLQHVRVLFVSFVQGLFAESPVGSYHWDPDIDKTEIVISDESPIKLEVLNQRPAISFTRGPVQFYGLGLDDMQFYDMRTAKKTKAILVPGTMSINCCSRVDIESENIAWVVAEMLWLLRELLLKQGFFELGRHPQISSPSPAGSIVMGDQGDEWFCTTVSIPYQFPRMSNFTPLGNEIANSIELSLEAVHNNVVARGAQLAGHELPVGVTRCFPPSFAPDASDAQGATPDPAGTRSTYLPIQPHPLNPAAKVVVRSANPQRPGLRPPSMGGSPLPIKSPCG